MTLVATVTQVLPFLTLLSQIVLAIGLLFFIFSPGARGALEQFLSRRALLIAFIVALAATLGSLFYSEIAHYEPCKLCWFQRIFLYPQVVLLGIALLKNDKGITPYAIMLSAIGGVIALYHYLLQRGIAPELPCSAVGLSASCSKVFVMSFGYITIPMMALTAFLLIIILLSLPHIRLKKY